MPGSERAEDGRAETGRLVGELDALEGAVERLLSVHEELRTRTRKLERDRRSMETALSGAQLDALEPEGLEERLRELADENRRLRERLEEGRRRAERIRSRLIVMEDEV